MQTAYVKYVYERRQRGRREEAKAKRRTAKSVFTDLCRALIAFLFTQVGVCALVVGYNVIGAFAFMAIEGEGEDVRVNKANQAMEELVETVWNTTVHLNVLHEQKWRIIVSEVVLNYEHKIVPLVRIGYRGIPPEEVWTFPAALMYSLTVYTTIGYGNITPRTDWGKIATIFYAIFGMPLMLLYMSNLGEILAQSFKFLYFKACKCGMNSLGYYRSASGSIHPYTAADRSPMPLRNSSKGHENQQSPHGSLRKNASHQSNTRSSHTAANGNIRGEAATSRIIPKIDVEDDLVASFHETSRKTIPITSCLVVITAYVLGGAILFSTWEQWSFLDGAYFCYVSLSTIGLGDRVPGLTLISDRDDADFDYKLVICCLYLLVGMALVAMCFNLMQEEAIENMKSFWRSLGCLRLKRKKRKKKLSRTDERFSYEFEEFS